MADLFIRKQEIRRSSIHDRFKGNRQSGISVPKDEPYIFIFRGKNGHKNGYEDGWDEDGTFYYTGEGKTGNMVFNHVNSAIRDHVKNKRRLFLFYETRKGFVQFIAELELEDWKYFKTRDVQGKRRNAIKFFFKQKGQLSLAELYTKDGDLEESNLVSEPNVEYGSNKPNQTERRGLVTSRVGQGWYRKNLLERWENKCAVSNYNDPSILIASHILPWRLATDEEKLDVENGILLSPVYDALFDKGLISFSDKGEIMLSKLLKKKDISLIGISGKERIQNLSKKNIYYLSRHREQVFQG